MRPTVAYFALLLRILLLGFIGFCGLSDSPLRGQTESKAALVPLGPADLATLLEVNAKTAEIEAALLRRGYAGPMDGGTLAEYRSRGASVDFFRVLVAAPAGPAGVAFEGSLLRDPQAGVTWYLPPGFTIKLHAGGGRVYANGLPASTELDLSWNVHDVPVNDLSSRGIHRIADWQELRLKEIQSNEGANWRRIGSWPLTGLGWSGRHTVFENAADSRQPLTYCLTWFVVNQKLVSVRTVLRESELRPRHDEIVDRITQFLRCSGPGIFDQKTWLRRMQTRATAQWLLVGKEGALSSWQPETGERESWGGRGFSSADWRGHYDSAIGTKNGQLVRRRRGSLSDDILVDELPGIAQGLQVSSLGDRSVLERLALTQGDHPTQPLRRVFGWHQGSKGLEERTNPSKTSKALGAPIRFQNRSWWPIKTPKGFAWCAQVGEKKTVVSTLPISSTSTKIESLSHGGVLYALLAEVSEDGKKSVRIIAFRDARRDSGRELFRMPFDAGRGDARLRLGLLGETLILVLPGQGLFEISKDGGLLLERLSDPDIRDARVGLR